MFFWDQMLCFLGSNVVFFVITCLKTRKHLIRKMNPLNLQFALDIYELSEEYGIQKFTRIGWLFYEQCQMNSECLIRVSSISILNSSDKYPPQIED